MRQPIFLVDMDGTLVDTHADLAASVNHTLAALGMPPRPVAEIVSFIGNGAATLLAQSLRDDAPERLRLARDIFFAHYEAHLLETSRLFSGWEHVLQAPYRMVVATNKPERFAQKIVSGLGLEGRFDLVVGGDTLPVKKPSAGVADYVAETIGVERSRFVMIGDGIPDGQLAAACGFPFWAVRWGYTHPSELEPYAERFLEHPIDILSSPSV